jgi:hypothetical protein
MAGTANTICRFAGGCHRDGTTLVRIHGVGDRRVCDEHLAWMTETGMDFRVLPITAFVPMWRQRLGARDETARIVA